MKNKILKSLIVGLCCSFLFSTGSFASSQKNNDVSVKENLNLPSISLIDSLLFQKSESNGECCNTASVIIRLGDNFGERAGYYKLDLQLTFLTLYGREIKETTYPEWTSLPSEGGGSISVYSTNGGPHCFLDPFELFLYGITPDNAYYIPEDGYLVCMDRGHNCPLYFKKLDECPSGGVALNQPTSITKTVLEKNIPNHTIEVIAKLGEEFGENAGYYVLDVSNSFDESDNVKGKTFGYSQVSIGNNQFEVHVTDEYAGISELFNLDLTPSCVSKETKNDKDYLVLEDNDKKLYFEKINNCYTLDKNDGVALCSDEFIKAYIALCDSNSRN